MGHAGPKRRTPEVAVFHKHVGGGFYRDVVVPNIDVCVVDPKWLSMHINPIRVWCLETTQLHSILRTVTHTCCTYPAWIDCFRPVNDNIHVRDFNIVRPELDYVISAVCCSEVP